MKLRLLKSPHWTIHALQSFDRKEKIVSSFSITGFDVLIAFDIHLQYGLVSNNDKAHISGDCVNFIAIFTLSIREETHEDTMFPSFIVVLVNPQIGSVVVRKLISL